MKNHALTLVLAVIALAFAGCKAPTDIAYFQDMHEAQSAAVQELQQVVIKPYDKITIMVKSKDEELSEVLNLTTGAQSSTSSQNQYAYTVDEAGCIDMPMLGKVKVAGMTRPEIAAYIKGQLVAKSIVLDPVVIVEYRSLSYSVLGEVRTPGRYEFDKDHVTLLEAIAKAGDLQITGERKNVCVIRNEGGVQKHYYVDLTDAASLYQSPVYCLQQHDVVYVEPNAKRMRESRPNGNTFSTASFWIGIVSMMASMTSIIVNLAN